MCETERKKECVCDFGVLQCVRARVSGCVCFERERETERERERERGNENVA